MFKQCELNFSYDALEPHIDALTVETHYAKHHATYTKNLNDVAEKAGVADKKIEELLSSLESVDESYRTALRNNGGGFYNHNLYFETISPNGGGTPSGAFGDKINETFGSFESFKEQISALAISQFGSGWAWLSVAKDGSFILSNSGNQDNPISLGTGHQPIMCIDVWEHAYYLKYKNLRGDYVKELFEVIDWSIVGEKYENTLR